MMITRRSQSIGVALTALFLLSACEEFEEGAEYLFGGSTRVSDDQPLGGVLQDVADASEDKEEPLGRDGGH